MMLNRLFKFQIKDDIEANADSALIWNWD